MVIDCVTQFRVNPGARGEYCHPPQIDKQRLHQTEERHESGCSPNKRHIPGLQWPIHESFQRERDG